VIASACWVFEMIVATAWVWETIAVKCTGSCSLLEKADTSTAITSGEECSIAEAILQTTSMMVQFSPGSAPVPKRKAFSFHK